MKKKQLIAAAAILLALSMVLSGCAGMMDLLGGRGSWQEQYDLGMRCLEDGDYEEAILAFTAAIEIDDSRPEAYIARAEAYKAVDEPEKALKDYKKARRIVKNNDEYEDLLEDLEDWIEKLEEWIDSLEDDRNEDSDHDENRDEDWNLNEDWTEEVPENQPGDNTDVTVTDAYVEYLVDYYGVECCYHIPQVHLPGDRAAAFNREIYGELMHLLDNNVYYTYPDGGVNVNYGNILYSWGVKGDLMSLLVVVRRGDYEWTDFYPYTISLKTGEQVSDDVLLAAYGLDEAGFRELAKERLSDLVSGYSPEMIEMIGEEFYEYIVTSTVSDENLAKAKPYIGQNGDLCMAAGVYGAAGAGYYWHTYDLEDWSVETVVRCTMNHAATNNPTAGYSPAEITEMVVQWCSSNIGVNEEGYFSASDQETWEDGGFCNVAVRFVNTDPDYRGEANVLFAVAVVNMTNGDLWLDDAYMGKLW